MSADASSTDPVSSTEPAPPEVSVVQLDADSLAMLINNLTFAIKAGSFNMRSVEELHSITGNLIYAKRALQRQGFTPVEP